MKTLLKLLFIFVTALSANFITTGCNADSQDEFSEYDIVEIKISKTNINNVLNLYLTDKPYYITMEIIPAGIKVSPKDFIYEIENETIATIDENGMITMLKTGETKINVSLKSDQMVNTSCMLKINPEPELEPLPNPDPEEPELEEWYDRTEWEVLTDCKYAAGDAYILPKLIDGNSSTFISIYKPDYGDKHPEFKNTEVYFVIDAKKEIRFDQLLFEHRHNDADLTPSKIKVSGSNDNEEYTLIKEDIEVPYSKGYMHIVELPVSNYRYIRVDATQYPPTAPNGLKGAIQIAEFNLGNIIY